ncbi:MAG TPA: sensor histidine kinase [Clostridiales bacterium]|nr:sensor histidine kinase [Clostridiales bacterium]
MIIKKFKLTTIRTRIILLFIIVAIFQIAVTAVFAVTQLKPHITNTYIRHQSQMSKALFWQLINEKSKMENYSVNIIGDSEIQDFFHQANKRSKEEYTPGMTTNLRNRILSYTENDNMIKAIYLVDNNNLVYSNYMNRAVVNFINNKIDVAASQKGRPVWDTDYNGKDVIMYRAVNNTTTDLTKKVGAIFMVIDLKIFTDTLNRFSLDTNQKYVLLSKDERMKVGDLEALQVLGTSEEEFLYHNEEYLKNYNDNKDWAIFAWVNKSAVYRPVYVILRILLIEIMALMILTIGLIIFLSGRITKPIADISRAMRQMGKGNIGINIPVTSNDEFGGLAETMNRMSKRIEELVVKIKEDQRNLRSLELKAMQYQINPHFLYNTLDSVHMFARKNNDIQSSELVIALSNFFRISLNHGHEFIKLADEVQHAVYYLEIQNIRFRKEFEWKVLVEEGLENLSVLKFILQPLVENSLTHGIRNVTYKGRIWLKIYKNDSKIVFEIKDNGIGILPDRLEELRKSIEEEDKETDLNKGGFGMRNVHQRLKIFYGDEAGLHIDSEWEEGTTISFQIHYDMCISYNE